MLFGFAGLMSAIIVPVEKMLTAPLADKFTQSIPTYFDWNNMDYLNQYSKAILLITAVVFFLLNVIVGPIVEELFFRGYLCFMMHPLPCIFMAPLIPIQPIR